MNSKKYISTLLYLTILTQNNLYSNKINYNDIYSLNLNQKEQKYILPLIIFKGEEHSLFNQNTKKQIYLDMSKII